MESWLAQTRSGGRFSEAAAQAHMALDRLTAPACRATAEAALSLPEDEKLSLLGDVLTRWLSLEPEQAMTWALPHLQSDGPIFTQLGTAWAWRDPATLVAWYERGLEVEEETLRKKIEELDVAKWLATSNSEWHGRFAGRELTHRLGRENSFLLRDSLTTPEAAAAFADGLAESEVAWRAVSTENDERRKQNLLHALRDAWLRVDPDGWTRWAEGHSALAELARDKLNDDAALFSLREDASTADRWLSKTPPEQQSETMGQIIDTWAARDLDAAGAWLAAQGGGEKTWAAAEAFAKQAAAVDPDAAFQWAATIGDPARRARAERQTFLRWHDADPDAAMAWLEHSGWDEAQQTAVREMAAVQLAP